MSTLRVSNIQTVAGTNALTIQSTGVVNQNNLPAIHLDGNNGTTIDFGSNVEMLTSTYTQQRFAAGGISWNSTNGRITLPVAGTYCVMGSLYQQLGGNQHGRFQINKNGALQYIVQTGYTTADGQLWHCGIFKASANDYVTCNTGTFDPIRLYMGAFHFHFSVYLIS